MAGVLGVAVVAPALPPALALASRAALAQASCVPSLSSTIPASFPNASQMQADCFAWQQFIALNWAASTTTCGTPDTTVPVSQFGEPNQTTPVVWESFKVASEVFLPGAVPPGPFCAPQALPEGVRAAAATRGQNLGVTSPFGHKTLTMRNKFEGNDAIDLSAFAEASPNGAWLTAQSGLLTMYEIRMNQDEYNFINQNRLYDATVQPGFAVSGNGMNLPDGSPQFQSYGTVGSMEFKAAWLELDNPALWPSYKTSQAIVAYPGQTPKAVTVGLVGLHVIRKLPNAAQFVWATFEHTTNAPSTTDISNKKLLPRYDYYNAGCIPATDYYGCKMNKAPRVCQPGQQPPDCDPYTAPMQVVRETPIDSTAVSANQSAWTTIKAANADSVFLNYQLVNTLWPNASTTIVPGSAIAVPTGNPQPQGEPVANTTLETYVQKTICLDCHKSAPIASVASKAPTKLARPAPTTTVARSPGVAPSTTAAATTTGVPPPCTADTAPICAADYSFLLSRAEAPATVSETRRAEEDDAGGSSAVPWAVGGAVVVAAAVGGALGLRARRRSRGGSA